MDPVEWSRCMANFFFAHDDPGNDLEKFRNFIPPFVLRTFCNAYDQNMYVVWDQNQMPNIIGDSETLTIYRPERGDYETRHWSECFGDDNIYHSFFDNLTENTWLREGFHKFDVLKRVDRDIFNGLADPIWQIHQYKGMTAIPLRREDINTFRKHLYLMTSLQSRDRTMHLLAHDEHMEDARVRRRRFIENYALDHARDVWLRNAEQILDTPHHEVAENRGIFDLDREDYRANARDRFMVFWEAPPGEEFILTDSAFGGFEGGQIGAKKNSQINMTSSEHEQHVYSKDFMWHQLYVLSPSLVVALCHGTLMHPELTRNQRKRWGLRRSLLENLPHDLPMNYYKDMAKSEASFMKPGWTLPPDVEKVFGANDRRSIAHDRRKDDELLFNIHRLSSAQVALVNSVLLHNQHHGPVIKSVCIRPSPSYASLYQSLMRFKLNPWHKYSEERQNDYKPLIERLSMYVNSMPPQMPTPLHYPALQPTHAPALPPPPMYDPRFGDIRSSFSANDTPRYDSMHLEAGRPGVGRALSAHSGQSSLTSAFTPSSQSSNSYSSASSQSSTSTKTTSIDTPRFDSKSFPHKRQSSPTRKEQASSSHRGSGSDNSGNLQRSKSGRAQASKNLNIVIEHSSQPVGTLHSAGAPRGRQPEPAHRSQATSSSSSKKSSPNPTKAEIDRSLLEQIPNLTLPPTKAQQMPPPPQVLRNSVMPERPSYITETVTRPRPPERSRTEGQPPVLQSRSANAAPMHTLDSSTIRHGVPEPQLQPPRRARRSPERPAYKPEQVHAQNTAAPSQHRQSVTYDQPPIPQQPAVQRRTRSPERLTYTEQPQQVQTHKSSHSQDRQSYRFDSQPQGSRSANRSPERQPYRLEQPAHNPRSANRSPERQSYRMEQPAHSQRSAASSQDRQAYRAEQPQPPIPRSANRSPERPAHGPRGRHHEATRPEPQPQPQKVVHQVSERAQPEVPAHRGRYFEPLRGGEPSPPQRSAAFAVESAPHANNGGHERVYDAVRLEPQPQVQRPANRSPERTKIEAAPVQQRNVSSSSERSQHVNETARGNSYEVVKAEQSAPQPPAPRAADPTVNTLRPPQRSMTQPVSTQKPAEPQSIHEPRSPPMAPALSRNTSVSTEHSTRPGVEIVRGRSQSIQQPIQQPQAPPKLQAPAPAPQQQPRQQKIPAPPVVVERITADGTTEPVNPVVKQLRFEDETKSLTHKSSDFSLAGSMVVHLGDEPGQLNDIDDDDIEQVSDDASWEDEGFAESEDLMKPRKQVVRFADKPLSRVSVTPPITRHHPIERPASRLGKRGVEIQRPGSGLGVRRVEIPRPLSRNSQLRFESTRKGRSTHHPHAHGHSGLGLGRIRRGEM